MGGRKPRKGEAAPEESLTFEQALARLEEIADLLERGDLPLAQAIALAEEGLKLSRHCEQQLDVAEQKVELLVERMGSVGFEPMEPGAGQDEEEEG